MAASKLDVFLEQIESYQSALKGLKAGTKLKVIQQGDVLACATTEGVVAGLIPANVQNRLSQGEFVAAVKTLKRKNEAVILLEVRITSGSAEGQSGALRDPAPTQEEEDVARLTRDQLESLAGDDELRWMLRDERLQGVIRDIDGSADRERALIRALQAPNFKEFADKVLLRVAPDPL